MTRSSAYAVVLVLLWVLPGAPSLEAQEPPSGEPLSLPAAADTYLQPGPPNDAHGGEPTLDLAGGAKQRVLVRFDPVDLAVGVCRGSVTDARVRLFVESNGGNWSRNGRPVSIHRVTVPWSEAAATWRCPADGDLGNQRADCDEPWEGGAFVTEATDSVVHTDGTFGWIEYDVTRDVADFISGAPNHGWLVGKTPPQQNGRAAYTSREGSAGEGPRLDVTYLPAEADPDAVPPAVSFTVPSVPILMDQVQTDVGLEIGTTDFPVDPDTLVVTLDGTDVTATCEITGTAALCRLPPLTEATSGASEHVVEARVVDCAGNVGEATLTVAVILGEGDTQVPEVLVTSPADGLTVRDGQVVVEGLVLDDGEIQVVLVNGVPAERTGNGFRAVIDLEDGPNPIVVMAIDGSGKTGQAALTVTRDGTPPLLSLDAPADGLETNSASLLVLGTVSDDSGEATVTVDGVAVEVTGGFFEATVPLAPGDNLVTVVARDGAGNEQVATRGVRRLVVPALTVTSPVPLSPVATPDVEVVGTVDDPAARVRVNGIEATVAPDGVFLVPSVPLAPGPNRIEIEAVNDLGLLSTTSVVVVRDADPPRLGVDAPQPNSVVTTPTLTVRGTVMDRAAGAFRVAPPEVRVNGVVAGVEGERFVVEGVALAAGANTLTVEAEDASGNLARVDLPVVFDATPRSRVEAVSGSGQTAPIGEPLADPLVVRVTDAAGLPVPGRAVLFKVTLGDGAFASGRRQEAVTTDGQGLAAVDFTLGTRAGTAAHVVEALVAGFAGPAVFVADALPAAPALVSVDSGDQQVGITGQPLPDPMVAAVTDAGFNRLAGIDVLFRIVEGTGHFADGTAEQVVSTDRTGRAVAPTLILGQEDGAANNVVQATAVGLDGPFASFVASGRTAGDPAATSVSGIVLDNSNQPVPGTTLHIAGTDLEATADANGTFRIDGVPPGFRHLLVDGATATRPGVWPHLEFTLNAIPGRDNTVGMPIFLLPLKEEQSVFVSETEGGLLTLPEVPGFSLDVAPGSVTFPDGSRTGLVSVTVVHSDKVPMVPNFGQQPRLIVTIQPANAVFDPPARMTLPNVDGLAPGAVTEMYSFDHDLGRFVTIGPASVTDDGLLVVSAPGTGVVKAGWHCGGNPASSGTTHDCPTCKRCVRDRCVTDDTQTPPQGPSGDCNREICFMGGPARLVDFSDTPPPTPGDCMKEICSVNPGAPGVPLPGFVKTVTDDTDAPAGSGCCDGQTYDLASECCTRLTKNIVPKNPMPFSWPVTCPDRVAFPGHVQQPNGCGSPALPVPVPEDPNIGCENASFTLACNAHDNCYSTCRSDRAACDLGFLAAMLATCDTGCSGFLARDFCRGNALRYYAAVSSLGYLPWHGGQQDACQCCP